MRGAAPLHEDALGLCATVLWGRWSVRMWTRSRGLSPLVAIEQKTTNKEPPLDGRHRDRDQRLPASALRSRSRAYSPETGEEMSLRRRPHCQADPGGFAGRKIALLPSGQWAQATTRKLFESVAKKGYLYARIDGEIANRGRHESRPLQIHTIDLVIDALSPADAAERILTSLRWSQPGQGFDGRLRLRHEGCLLFAPLMCPSTACRSRPGAHTFSFNSPKGRVHAATMARGGVHATRSFPTGAIAARRCRGALGKCGMLSPSLRRGPRHVSPMDDRGGHSAEQNAILYGDAECTWRSIFRSSRLRRTVWRPGRAGRVHRRTEDDIRARGRKAPSSSWPTAGARVRRNAPEAEALQFRIAGRTSPRSRPLARQVRPLDRGLREHERQGWTDRP